MLDISIVCPECQRVVHASYCSQSCDPAQDECQVHPAAEETTPWPDEEVTEKIVWEPCPACHGSNDYPVGVEYCYTCSGHGRVICGS